MYILDMITALESRIPLAPLWSVLDVKDRSRLMRSLQNGDLDAEGRGISSGHCPPHTEILDPFSRISREAWHIREAGDWFSDGTIQIAQDLDDLSEAIIDIHLINCATLVQFLDLDPDQWEAEIDLQALSVDGQKMSAKVWAAMAAMVAHKKVELSPSAITNLLLDRHELWAHGPIDADRLRKYVRQFILDFRAFANWSG